MANLVDNAVKYSPPGTAIDVTVDGPSLEVRDQGDGIDPVDQPHVFGRFYRADDRPHRARLGPRSGHRAPDRRAPRRGGLGHQRERRRRRGRLPPAACAIPRLTGRPSGSVLASAPPGVLVRIVSDARRSRARSPQRTGGTAPPRAVPGRVLASPQRGALNHPMEAAAPGTSNQGTMAFLWAALAGAAVSLVLGVYAREHHPAGQALFTLGFSGTINMKAWLATLALTLAVVQIVLALWMYGKLGRSRRAVVGRPDPPVGGDAARSWSRCPSSTTASGRSASRRTPDPRAASSTPSSAACSTAPSRPRSSACGRRGCRAGPSRWSAASCSPASSGCG